MIKPACTMASRTAAAAGTTAEVSGGRIVGMRMPEGGTAQGPGYMQPETAVVARDLQGCGFGADAAGRLAEAVMRFLGDHGGPHRMTVTGDDLTEVARALAATDPLRMSG